MRKALKNMPSDAVEVLYVFRPYVSDADLARVAGVSRQRIGQLLGPRQDRRDTWEQDVVRQLGQCLGAGLTIPEAHPLLRSGGYDVSRAQLRYLATKHGLKRDLLATRGVRREQIRQELREFLTTGLPFTQNGIEFFNSDKVVGRNLWARMVRLSPWDGCTLSPLDAWAEEMCIQRPRKRQERIMQKEPM